MRAIDADALIDKTDDRYSLHEIGRRERDDIVDALEYAPTIQLEPHWIPVTENTLPEDGIPVNVTWVNRKPEFYYSEIKDKPYTATAIYFRGRWFWYSCVIEDWLAEYGSNESFLANLQEAVDRDIEITAWMPLPEPMRLENK